MQERLQKILAHCGVASRRASEDMIRAGRVVVNGRVVTEMGVKVDPGKDSILVDGRKIRHEAPAYYLLHKPKDCTTTADDELGRRTVVDLMKTVKERVYPVGRLDRESEGLLVMTNDGQLAHFLTHPSCEVKKIYRATVDGRLEKAELARVIQDGVRLGPILIKPLAARVIKQLASSTLVEITVGEGINREVRRLFAALGHEVKKLVRIQVGPLSLKGIPKSRYRPLRQNELAKLRELMKAAGVSGDAAAPAPPPRGRRKRQPAPRMGKPDPATAGTGKKPGGKTRAGKSSAPTGGKPPARAGKSSAPTGGKPLARAGKSSAPTGGKPPARAGKSRAPAPGKPRAKPSAPPMKKKSASKRPPRKSPGVGHPLKRPKGGA